MSSPGDMLSVRVPTGVLVGTHRFEPVPNVDEAEREGKFVIDMHYVIHEREEVKTKKFSVKWEGLDKTELYDQEYGNGMVKGWLEEVGVHKIAWGATIRYTLKALEKLVKEVHAVGPGSPRRRGSSLGLRVRIRVLDIDGFEDGCRDVVDVSSEPDYLEDDDDDDDDYMEEDEETEYGDDDDMAFEEVEDQEEEEKVYNGQYDEVVRQILKINEVNLFSELPSNGNTYHSCCAICLEEFNKDDKDDEASDDVAILPCDHVLHEKCLIPWVIKGGENTSCPLCRSLVFPSLLMD